MTPMGIAAALALLVLGNVVVSAIALYVLFLCYCTLRVARDNGKLAMTPLPVRLVAWSIVGVAWVFDVVFNVIIGSLMFLELPDVRALTFTARCSSHMAMATWRGTLARWVCDGWLNPMESDHCRR